MDMDEEDKKKSDGNFGTARNKLKEEEKKQKKAQIKRTLWQLIKKNPKVALIILVVVLVIILLLAAISYLLDMFGFEETITAKEQVFGGGIGGTAGNGTGYSYSEKVVQMNNGNWELNVNDEEYNQQLSDAGFDTNNMGEDEKIIQLLILNGVDPKSFTEEELKLLPYLLKAELASQQLDLRSATEMYDSNGSYIAPDTNNLGENEIQGSVHLKRINSKDMSNVALSYVDYETFKGYNNNVEEAKKYFSFNDNGDLVVYTWNHVKYTYEYINGKKEVPEDLKQTDTDTYNLQETVIDYKPLISKYTLPFEVLTALLIITEDCNFTKQIADLAFTANIEIALIEEYTEDTIINVTEYKETIRDYKYVNGTVSVSGSNIINETNRLIKVGTDNSATVYCEHTDPVHGTEYTSQVQNFDSNTVTYTVKETAYTETNNYKYGVTKADIWFANIEKTFLDPKEEISGPTNSTSDSIGDFEIFKDAENTSSGDSALNEIKSFSASLYNEYTQKISNSESSIPRPAVVYNGTDLLIGPYGGLKNVTTYVPSSVALSGFVQQTYTPGINNTCIIPNATEVVKVIVTSNQGNSFTFEKNGSNTFELTSATAGVINNLNITTYQYRKVDTKNTTTVTKTSWLIEEGETKQEWYDQKGEKFLKAIEENPKAEELLYSVDLWLYEMLDEYDSSFTTIIKYLLDMYLNGSSNISEDELVGVLDLYGTDGFQSLSNSYGLGTDWWWPIGSAETTVDENGVIFANGEPVATRISASYPTYPSGGPHTGIDITGCPRGTNIIAAKAGTVIEAVDGHGDGYKGSKAGYANKIVIQHDDGTKAIYAHLEKSTIKVKVEDIVKQGQLIAGMGTSGNSTGIHLHFEIRDASNNTLNPNEYVSAESPRPTGTSTTLQKWLWGIEGGSEYIKGDTWIVFDPAGAKDNTMNLAHGMVVASYDGGDSWYPDIIPGKITVGQTVTAEQANQIWEIKIKGFCNAIDSACVKYNVTLNTNQRDALISCIYRLGYGNNQHLDLVEAYKTGGNAGLWAEMKTRYNKAPEYEKGTKNRLAEEYELFVKGDYIYQNTGYTKYNQYCSNPNI